MHDSFPVLFFHDIPVTVKELGDFSVHYIEGGSPEKPTLLLLHGFPSSSNQFRDFAKLICDHYHVLAPDLPAYGHTTSPKDFVYNFDNLTAVIAAWLEKLKINSYAVYIFDYGAPVTHRLALQDPKPIKAIISQNGNSYDEGFGHPFWDPIMSLWKSENSAKDRDFLVKNILNPQITEYQYREGVPKQDQHLIDPMTYSTDYLMNLAGEENQRHQLDLFYDYRKNKEMYPKVHEYFQKSQVPLLAVWGKGDPAFIPPGAEAYKKDLPNAEVHLLDAGHFALETKGKEVASLVIEFLDKVDFKK